MIEFQDVASGDFVYGDMPEGPLSSVALLSAAIDPRPGGVALVTAQIWSEDNLDGTALIINVREEGTGGYASSEVWVSSSTCPSGPPVGCFAEIYFPLTIRPSNIDDVDDEDELDVELSLGIFTPAGPEFTTAVPLPDPWIVATQPANTIAMSGRLSYARLHQVGKSNPMDALHPQFGILSVSQEVTPLRRVTIEVADTCAHTYTTETRKDGFWHMYVPKECVDTNYTVNAKPLTSFGMYRVRTRDFNDVVYAVPIGSANVPGTTKSWGDAFFNPTLGPYGEFSTFMVGVEVQEWAKPYLVGDGKVGTFPWMNFSYEEGQLADHPDCEGTSCYSSAEQMIRVGSGEDNPDQKDEWTLTHEAFHWFQDMFMVKLDGNSSGAGFAWSAGFGEGFASMMHGNMRSEPWMFIAAKNVFGAEHLDFQGNFTEAGAIADNWVPALPFDLYATTGDAGSGGWSWRILWDFFDDSDVEPGTVFARFDDDGSNTIGVSNPATQNFGSGFDTIGTAAMFQDVLVRYLGGNHMPANASRPALATRGDAGLDMTEFLDGILCRGHLEWEDMEPIVLDMMDFAYNPDGAPLSCGL